MSRPPLRVVATGRVTEDGFYIFRRTGPEGFTHVLFCPTHGTDLGMLVEDDEVEASAVLPLEEAKRLAEYLTDFVAKREARHD